MNEKLNVPIPLEIAHLGDDLLVFFSKMVEKLHANRHKGKWEGLNVDVALKALETEVLELLDALQASDTEGALEEAADVANWCLIISNMCLAGRDYPFASRTKLGRAMDFLKWATVQEVDHCLIWPFKSKTGPNMEYGGLSKGLSPFGRRAHRVVCGMAHGEPEFEDAEAEHLCGNSLCVNPRHLKWATRQENENRKKEHGTNSTPIKLSRETAKEIREEWSGGLTTIVALAEKHGVSDTNIRNIINNKTYKETT